eukprot:1187289-Prorocentrum_minimum.AAC.1
MSALMLKLCAPFMDPTKADRIGRIDVSYATDGARLDLSEKTKLAANSDEVRAQGVEPIITVIRVVGTTRWGGPADCR